MDQPPGTERPQRFRPRLHWELLVWGVSGHELLGTDVAHVRLEDAVVLREERGLRWYRCVRCDSWLPLPPPAEPTRETPPARDEVELPLRGKALRDKIVLRVIAVDRAIHFLVLGFVAVAVFFVAANQLRLKHYVFHLVNAVQGTSGDPTGHSHGIVRTLLHALELRSSTLYWVGAGAAAYAVLEGAEAVGLWLMKRWAEYLTFVATTVLLPLEVYEIVNRGSALKVIGFIVNLAVVIYLLFAKRLFGLRGGGAADERERARDVSWEAIERATPPVS